MGKGENSDCLDCNKSFPISKMKKKLYKAEQDYVIAIHFLDRDQPKGWYNSRKNSIVPDMLKWQWLFKIYAAIITFATINS